MPAPKTLNLQKWMDWEIEDSCDCGCKQHGKWNPSYNFNCERECEKGKRYLCITFNECSLQNPHSKYLVLDECECPNCDLVHRVMNEEQVEDYIIREWSDVIDFGREQRG